LIREFEKCFELSTKDTTYAFRIRENGLAEHLYYGAKMNLLGNPELAAAQVVALAEKQVFAPGNSILRDQEDKGFSPEYCALELSAPGKGDVREPMVEVVGRGGVRTLDFVYDSHEISQGKKAFETLPGSYDEAGKVWQLKVVLKDEWQKLTLELYYWVYEDCNVITRSAVLVNDGEESVEVLRLLSMLTDLEGDAYKACYFTGAWAREMQENCVALTGGKLVLSSATGTSSNRVNPFFFLEKNGTGEDFGECMGFNLIYSGNHYEAIEVSPYGKTRIVSGISPQGFVWKLGPGERFEAPEAVMTYSANGRNGMSRNMHAFVREHIVRGTWKKKERPILLNSWEAFYFDFNESKLLHLAQAAKNVGIELFVLDDGWFGKRDDDTSSLGDWTENKKKLPGGLAGLAKKVNALGLDFGVWVEPEMVNVDSELYRAHPEWVLEIPGKAHSEGRNQRILDLSNPAVQEWLIAEMGRVFSSANIAYVKWDMNRIYTDAYSQALPAEQQGEVTHRCQMGLYHCMKELTEAFPDILFEGCASGGNRFDLGILCYFPQIWASDNTDAMCRAQIQNGYSYGYPQSVIGAHVSSCPNHQTLRVTPLETRFAVASFGVLGYECNLADMKKEDLEAIKVQIEIYKNWRSVLQFGTWIRGASFGGGGGVAGSGVGGFAGGGFGGGGFAGGSFGGGGFSGGVSNLRDGAGNLQEWFCVSEDKTREICVLLQRFAIPNNHSVTIRPRGLDGERIYRFTNRDLKHDLRNFGDLVNMVAPIHVKQDSLLHNAIAKFVKLDGETEDYVVSGDMLMRGGIALKQPYGGTGFNEQVRYFPDFGARMYFVEECALQNSET
jgi:alpha-galactosidase